MTRNGGQLFFILCWVAAFSITRAGGQERFFGTCRSLSQEERKQAREKSWRAGCPVPVEDLGLVIFSHWNLDGEVRQGSVIVHRLVCQEVLEIFRELFRQRFPIEKARPIHFYDGDDNLSMADNNTSGFNCRRNTGRPEEFSLHAYGLAVDINPIENPQIINGRVIPEQAEAFRDREQRLPGMLHRGDAAWQAFHKRGWMWGGTWRRSKDYQHFEKRSLLPQLTPKSSPRP